MPSDRCSRSAFYTADGRKVTRRDRPRVVIDGELVDVVLRTPRTSDQVHLLALGEVTPVLLADGTVVPVSPRQSRGRRGRAQTGRAYLTGMDTNALSAAGVPVTAVVPNASLIAQVPAATGVSLAGGTFPRVLSTLGQALPPVSRSPHTAANMVALLALAAVSAVAVDTTLPDDPPARAAQLLIDAVRHVAPGVVLPPFADVMDVTTRVRAAVDVLTVPPAGLGTDAHSALAAQLRDVAAIAAGHLPAPPAAWQIHPTSTTMAGVR